MYVDKQASDDERTVNGDEFLDVARPAEKKRAAWSAPARRPCMHVYMLCVHRSVRAAVNSMSRYDHVSLEFRI